MLVAPTSGLTCAALGAAGPGSSVVGDGLHLSAQGQRFVGQHLLALLREEMRLPMPADASPQERLAFDVPGLPIELPAGYRMDPVDYVECIAEHRRRAQAARAGG
jgi:hypothetical protein